MRLPVWCLFAVSGASIFALAGEVDLDGLKSKDENVQIETLWAIAEAGDLAAPAADDIAKLMTESWHGKRLSRWCYYALTKISKAPDKWLDAYIASAGWLHFNVVPVGQSGVIGGPQAERNGPPLPEGLREASKTTWRKCLALVVPMLKEKDRDKLDKVNECLRQMDAPAELIVPELAKILDDGTAPQNARVSAAELIGNYGPYAGSVEILARGLKDKAPAIQCCCAHAMGQLGSPYLPYGGSARSPRHPNVRTALALLQEALHDPLAEVREHAAMGLGEMRAEAAPALGVLTKAAKEDTNPRVRFRAIASLADTGLPAALVVIAAAMSDPDKENRKEAARAMGDLGGALRKSDPASFEAQAQLAVPALIEALKQRDGASDAAQSLGLFGPAAKAAIPALHGIVKESADKNLVGRAIFSLGQIGESAKNTVSDVIKAGQKFKDTFGLVCALEGIGEGSREAEDVLIMALGELEDHVRRNAAKALGAIAVERAPVIEALERMQEKERDPKLKSEAKTAIHAIRTRAKAKQKVDF